MHYRPLALAVALCLLPLATLAQRGNRVLVLTGTTPTADWALQTEATLSLSGTTTLTFTGIPTTTAIKTTYGLMVSSAGGIALNLAFPGTHTTNWLSNFTVFPHVGQTYYLFEQYGTVVRISTDPAFYPTANEQVLRRKTGTNGFGAILLSSTEAVEGDLPWSNLAPVSLANRLLGRNKDTAGDIEEIELGNNLLMLGTTLNAIGGVGGPASATDNAIARFNGTGGTNIQNSGVIIDDSNNITGVNSLDTTTLNVGTLNLTNALGTAAIANNAITGAKIAMGSDAQGDVLYYNGTDYVRLPAGTSGQFLQTLGAGANPAWATASGTGDVVGPASSTDNALARYDSTTGKLLQNSIATLDDTGNLVLGDASAASSTLTFSLSGATDPLLTAADSAFGVTLGGTERLSIGTSQINAKVAILGLGTGSDVLFTREAAAILQMGSDSATPTSQVIKGPDGSGTDIAGGSTRLAGGRRTGTGAGGLVALQTTPSATATGSGAGTLVDRYVVVAKGKVLTDATAVSLFEVALPTLATTGGEITATIRCSNGTDVQSFTQKVYFASANKAGAYTDSIGVDADADKKTVTGGSTLTATWTILDGTDKITIQLNADTSLTPSANSFMVYYTITNNSEQAITVL